MGSYLIRRLGQSLAVLFVASLVVFLLTRAAGDPIHLLLPLGATEEMKQIFRERHGLDAPLYSQFAVWLGNVIQGELGYSYRTNRPVASFIAERLPRSIVLAGASLTVAWVIGVVTGVIAAIRPGTYWDWAFRGFAIVGQGIPAFWLALMLQFVFTLKFPIFPVTGAKEPLSVVLPAVTLGWYVSAGIMRLVRSGMLTALSSDYTLFARSKGLPEWVVVVKHGFRNALIPPLTFLGLYVGILIGSAVIVEVIFAYPGIGALVFESVLTRDFPTLQGLVLVVLVSVVISSWLIDLTYALIDPRVRG